MEWLKTILALMSISEKTRGYIKAGTAVLNELQKEDAKVIPILERVGGELFPEVKDQISIVAAAADALFNPEGTKWIQTSLNKLQNAGLDVDGEYGRLTKEAVAKFQTEHQPESGTVDGWAGPVTRKAIKAALAK